MKLTRFQPTIRHLKEPSIEVGDGVAVPEPKMGWTLVGPLGESTKTYEINLGLIGDAESLEKTRDLIEKLKTTSYGKDKSFLHVDFPGVSKLRIKLNIKWEAPIDGNLLKQKIEKATSFQNRIDTVGRIIREKINALMDRDPQPDILILAYPKIVDDYCIKGAIGRKGVPRKTALEKSIIESRAKHIPLDHYLGMQAPQKYTNH